MADEPQTSADEKGGKGFFKEMSRSAVKRALAPLAATAATAGTAYLTRKATQIWNESVLPKVREKGGGKAFTKDALEQAASKVPHDGASGWLRGVAERFEDRKPAAAPQQAAQSRGEAAQQSGARGAGEETTDPKREQRRPGRPNGRRRREGRLGRTRRSCRAHESGRIGERAGKTARSAQSLRGPRCRPRARDGAAASVRHRLRKRNGARRRLSPPAPRRARRASAAVRRPGPASPPSALRAGGDPRGDRPGEAPP